MPEIATLTDQKGHNIATPTIAFDGAQAHAEIHDHTVGLKLLDREVQRAQWEAIIDDPELPPAMRQSEQESLLKAQEEARQDIAGKRSNFLATKGAERTALAYAIWDSMPKAQKRFYQEDPYVLDVVEWLCETPYKEMPSTTESERKLRDAQHLADDQRILNFLQAHSEYMKERQKDPEFLANVEHYKQVWQQGVVAGVEDGSFDASAVERLTRLGGIKIYEGDNFSTKLEETGGYYIPGSDEIVVAREWHEATVHELNHALLDGWQDLEVGDLLEYTWVNEAITEHIAMMMRQYNGEVDYDHGIYASERHLLQGMIQECQNRGIDLSMRDFTLAYTSEGETRANRVLDIRKKLEPVFGAGINVIQYAQIRIDEIQKEQANGTAQYGPLSNPPMIVWHELSLELIEDERNSRETQPATH